MTSRQPKLWRTPRAASGEPSNTAILAVGLTQAQAESVASRLFGALGTKPAELRLEDLTRERLTSAIAIISPIMATDFDAVDVAKRLAANGFRGRYFAVADTLPDRDLIRREVRAAAPGLSFDIVETGRGPYLAAS